MCRIDDFNGIFDSSYKLVTRYIGIIFYENFGVLFIILIVQVCFGPTKTTKYLRIFSRPL